VKIDRQLTTNVVSDPRAAALMRAVLGLTKELGLEAIAEGIETEAVRDFVLAAGATAGQGWFFAPALSPDGLPPALRASTATPGASSLGRGMRWLTGGARSGAG
jgi:EAL domain-containing protein (putative c-di-GMP-specific phosphodiesterase class I)